MSAALILDVNTRIKSSGMRSEHSFQQSENLVVGASNV